MATHVWSRLFSSPGGSMVQTDSEEPAESDMPSEVTLKDIKATVDSILLMLQEQAEKRDEEQQHMAALAERLDCQSEKLRGLEHDMESVKEILLKPSPRSARPEDDVPLDDSDSGPGNRSIALNDVSFRDEIVEAAKSNTSEVTFLVRKEVTRICDVCSQLSSDVSSTLDKTEDRLMVPLDTVRTDVKQVLTHVETLEKRIKDVENSTNEFRQTIQQLQMNSSPVNELRGILQTHTNTHLVNQTVFKDDMKKKLNSVADLVEKQSATMDTIQNELVIQGSMSRSVLEFNKSVVDQVVCEAQVTRDLLLKGKKARTSYTCDFHILNFSKWSGSGEECYSRLWYIDQARTHVKADVVFNGDMTMSVGLAHGRYPRVVGIDHRPGARVKVTVTAVKQSAEEDGWELGGGEIRVDEKQIPPECDGWLSVSGWGLADVTCEDLRSRGLIEEDMLLLRYVITVLENLK